MAGRTSDAPGLSKPGPIRLLTLGDCNTISSDPGQGTVPDGVIAALHRRGRSVELTNLGGGMETTREGLARLRHSRTTADLITVNYGLVDAWVTTIPRIYIPYFPDRPAGRLMRKVLKAVKRRLRPGWLRPFVPRGNVVRIEEYEANIRAIIAEARQRNPDVRVALWTTVPVTDHEQRNSQLQRYNDRLQLIASAEHVCLIDSARTLSELSRPKQLCDGIHLSIPAATRLGEAIVLATDAAAGIRTRKTAA